MATIGFIGLGNMGGVVATEGNWEHFPAVARVQVPPLGAVYFRHRPDMEAHV